MVKIVREKNLETFGHSSCVGYDSVFITILGFGGGGGAAIGGGGGGGCAGADEPAGPAKAQVVAVVEGTSLKTQFEARSRLYQRRGLR